MGRFDALLEIEDPKTPPQPVSPPVSRTKPQKTIDTQPGQAKMSTNPQTRFPTSKPTTQGSAEKPEKYTTHLEPSLVKKLKLYATEHDKKDYQVIREALFLYFQNVQKTT